VYAESTGDFAKAASGSTETSLVISNTSPSTATVSLGFSVMNGLTPPGGPTTIVIPPYGQFAANLRQISGFTTLPTPLQGVLRIATADSSQSIAVTAFRNRYNERGELIVSSIPSVPSLPLPADREIIFPQIVDGGGYRTSIVIVNDSSTAVPVLLRTVAPTGQALPLQFK
jgi:hypothetical protein